MIKDCNQKPAESRHSLQDGRENRAQTYQCDSVSAENIPDRVTHHADAILRAAGSSLRNYTMDRTRRAILSAVMDCYEEAYRAGAARAAQVMG